ncbi:hypothetical protein FOL47_002569 [Perkinsus chesapeaki]|uniref:Signal peptidase complex subunit 3 n=1 Tax=Perkinsus chesapeaki TaxID=330153 RepID=A0A7J6KNT7_PERCH|nr:hypothetical protein FOL47_002569 [Perkinsus chesapeaki]
MPNLLQLLSLVISVLVLPACGEKHIFQGLLTTKMSALTVRITFDPNFTETTVVYLADYSGKYSSIVLAQKRVAIPKGRYTLIWDSDDWERMKVFLRNTGYPDRPNMGTVDFADDWQEAKLYMFQSAAIAPLVLKPVS